MTSKLQAIKETVEKLERESSPRHPNNSEWIAFARTALPDLLHLAEGLEARLKVAEDALKLIVIDSERIGGFVACEKINDNATAALAEIRKDLNVSPAGVTKDEVL